jgi:hypothetical protein
MCLHALILQRLRGNLGTLVEEIDDAPVAPWRQTVRATRHPVYLHSITSRERQGSEGIKGGEPENRSSVILCVPGFLEIPEKYLPDW